MILLGFLAIASLVVAVIYCPRLYDDHEGSTILIGLFSLIFWLLLLAAIISNCASVSAYGEMRGFQVSAKAYLETAKNVKDSYYETGPSTGSAVNLDGLANLKQSTNLSTTWTEYRDKIMEYNQRLERYRAWSKMFPANLFIPAVPDDLKIIDWKEAFK